MTAAEALGPLLDCFDSALSWGWARPKSGIPFPSSMNLRRRSSAARGTDFDTIGLRSPTAEEPFYARDSGERLYKALTRADGWHADFTVLNANRFGRYVSSISSVMSLLSRVGRTLSLDPEIY